MARQIVENDRGQQLELVDGRWIPYYGAAEGVGVGEAIAIGTGRELTRAGRGLANIAAALPEALGSSGAAAYRRRLAEREADEAARYGELSRERPYASTVGELLPNLATLPLGLTNAAARTVGSVALEQGLIGAVTGAAGYQQGGLGDQALGGVLGGVLGAGGALAGDAFGRVVAARQAARARADELLQVALRAQQAPAPGGGSISGTIASQVQAPAVAEQAARAGSIAGQAAEAVAPGGQAAAAQAGQARQAFGTATRTPQADPLLEGDRLLARADELGLNLTAGQVLDNPSLRQLEASISSFPLTSMAEQLRKAGNRRQVNRIFGKALGLEGRTDQITEGALGQVFNNVDREFGEVASQIGQLAPDRRFLHALDAIEQRNVLDPVRTEKLVPILANIRDLFEHAGGSISGEAALSWRSSFNQAMRAAAQNGEPQLAQRLMELTGEFDDLIVRQAGEGLGERYAKARAQYRLADALAQPGVIKAGDVMAGRAHNALLRRYPAELARGNQYGRELAPELEDAFDALRITSRYGDIVGDSGTATRMSLQTLLSDPQGSITSQLIAQAAQTAIGRAGGALASPAGQAAAGALVQGVGGRTAVPGGILGRLAGVSGWNEGTQ